MDKNEKIEYFYIETKPNYLTDKITKFFLKSN